MSHNLTPPETQGIDVEGFSPWWTAKPLEEAFLRGDRLIRIRKDLPIMISTVELNFDMPDILNVKTEDDSVVSVMRQVEFLRRVPLCRKFIESITCNQEHAIVKNRS